MRSPTWRPQAAQVAEHESVAAEVRDVAAAAAEHPAPRCDDAQSRADAARATFDRLSDRDEANRLTARLAKIDVACAEPDRAENEIAANTVTDAVLRDIEVAAAAVDQASGLAELACARIELTSPADLQLLVQDRPVALSAEQTFTSHRHRGHRRRGARRTARARRSRVRPHAIPRPRSKRRNVIWTMCLPPPASRMWPMRAPKPSGAANWSPSVTG